MQLTLDTNNRVMAVEVYAAVLKIHIRTLGELAQQKKVLEDLERTFPGVKEAAQVYRPTPVSAPVLPKLYKRSNNYLGFFEKCWLPLPLMDYLQAMSIYSAGRRYGVKTKMQTWRFSDLSRKYSVTAVD